MNSRLITCFFVSLLCISILVSCGCTHEWQDPTCLSPKTCRICNTIEDKDILGEHTWLPATCTTPVTCSTCGKTKGIPNNHEWVNATCTSAKHCLNCDAIIGDPLGHTISQSAIIMSPTCLSSGKLESVCATCNLLISEMIPQLAHSPSQSFISTEATYFSSGIKSIKCTICSSILEESEYSLSSEEKEQWYKSNCKKIIYEKYARSPEIYSGSLIQLKGEVSAIVSEPDIGYGDAIYYINTKASYGYYIDNPVYLFLENRTADTRILEGDIITIYGQLDSLYQDGFGKLPKINVAYYIIH